MDWSQRLAELKPEVDRIIARHEGVAPSELRPMDNDTYISAARQAHLISSADTDDYFRTTSSAGSGMAAQPAQADGRAEAEKDARPWHDVTVHWPNGTSRGQADEGWGQ